MKKHFVLQTEARTVTATASEWRNNWPTKLTFHEEPSIHAEAVSENEAVQIRCWITWVDAQVMDYSKPSRSVGMQIKFTHRALAQRLFALEPETEAGLQAEYDRLYKGKETNQ